MSKSGVIYEYKKEHEILAKIENKAYDLGVEETIQNSCQPCRFEVIPNREETIVLDVCHNIDGF